MKHFCSFSEAIRVGISFSPQAVATLEGTNGSTCAIGSGAKALGLRLNCRTTDSVVEQLAETFPYLRDQVRCPACQAHFDEVAWVGVCLNDRHGWSRERIADWLESEEEKLGFVTLVENEASITSEEKALVTA